MVRAPDTVATTLVTFAVLDRRMCLLEEDTNDPTKGNLVVGFMAVEEVEDSMRLEVVGSVSRIGITNRTTMGSAHPMQHLGKTLSHPGI
jgi:hypothetical protein